MTLGEAQQTVAAYLNKSVPDLTVNGINKTVIALENARVEAEARHDFMSLRDRITLQISVGTEFTMPTVKRPIVAWADNANASSGPIPFISEQDAWRRSGAYNGPLYPQIPNYYSTSGFAIVIRGDKYWLFPSNIQLTPTNQVNLTVYACLRGTSYLTQDDSYTDFFLTYGFSYMLYRALRELQVMSLAGGVGVKSGSPISAQVIAQPALPVTQKMLDDSWLTLLTEDLSKSEGVFDVSLS